MKRTSLLLTLIVLIALPAVAQSSELGIIVGGSRRFVDAGNKEAGVVYDDSTFSLSNNAFDIFWAVKMEPDLYVKFKGGRIQGPVAVGYNIPGDTKLYRRDVEGEVQHIETNVEYRFPEAYGSTGLFAGVGYYRQTAPDSDSSANYGVNGGVNADFPLSRRYGIVLEGTYHWTNSHFQSRFMTAGVGLRVSF
jgi:hypothetical protein